MSVRVDNTLVNTLPLWYVEILRGLREESCYPMFKEDLLKDKVVLVTGGGSGLGKSMVQRFLELGAKVAICGRRADVLSKTREELQPYGDIFTTTCDVRDAGQITNMMNAVEEHFGAIDVLINNAAGNFISPTERLSPRAADAVINIVLHGTMYCTMEVGKRWIEQGRPGTVLNIVTTYATTGSAFVVPSAVAKAGVLAMTRSLAVEWGHHGIRQVAIAPGPFPTEGAWSRLLPTEDLANHIIERIPLRRVGDHSELTNLAAYLISDYAGYINGEVVTIDGGGWLQGAGEFNMLLDLTEDDWNHVREMTRSKK